MLNPVVAAINIPFILIGIAVTPKLAKRFGKRNTYIGLNAIFALGSLGFFLNGWDNFTTLLIWSCISSLGMAAPLVLQTSMIADTIEYAELKTGQRSEGLIFSSQTFMVKFSNALTSWVMGVILTATGFVANMGQSAAALQGIHIIISLFPFIACAIAIVPMFFYPLTEKKHAEILSMLESNQRPK